MRKVIVNCVVEYSYAAELSDEVDLNDVSDVFSNVDGQDPVYQTIRREANNVAGDIVSVIDAETGEILSEL